jgi:hypothetical protein
MHNRLMTSATKKVGRWSVLHFSQANPRGRRQGNVPALLRRVAATIASLGDVAIQDIAFHNEPDEDGNDRPDMTVYYYRASRRKAGRSSQDVWRQA